MTVREFIKHYPDYQVTESQLDYALYLERRGHRFLIDYGFENAERIAWAEIETVQ